MLKGKKPTECSYCWKMEDLGHLSDRHYRSSEEWSEPFFEEVDQDRLTAPEEPDATPEHFNELGVRKYDLVAVWQRWKNHFRGPAAANPRLVNYLAAGSIQGLRPLRYEKRVARNRFLLLVVILLLVLWGLFAAFIRK